MGGFSDSDVRAYYSAALVGLRFAEAQRSTGRRFGPDADARWSAFKGDLTTADRLDLLIRDANAEWPEAMGARTVFARRDVGEDEPFGPGWSHLDPVDAEEIWRAVSKTPAPKSVRDALVAAAACWELELKKFKAGDIAAADRLVIAGPSAIASAVEIFSKDSDLDWADQVIVVATPPAHRQLAALAGVLLKSTKPTRIILGEEYEPKKHKGRVLRSEDAQDEDAPE